MSADLLLGLPAKVKQLLDRLTASRATLLDNLSNLNTTVSSRAPASDTGTLLGRLTQPRADNLDLIPDLGGIGPPAGEMSFPEGSADITNAGAALGTVGEYNFVSVPTGSTVEALSLAGPGVLYFLGVTKPGSTLIAVTMELVIDGVTVTPIGGKSVNLNTDRAFCLVGALSAQSGVTYQPITYKTSVVLNLSTDAATTNVYFHHRHIPT